MRELALNPPPGRAAPAGADAGACADAEAAAPPGPGRPRILVAADPAEAAAWLADWIRERARESVAARGDFRLALSGGSTPLELYRRLVSYGGLPWTDCRLWLVDERFVPWGHPDHNASAIRGIFAPVLAGNGLDQPAEGASFQPIDTGLPDAPAAARHYEAALRLGFGLMPPGSGTGDNPSRSRHGLPVFDLILLGLGADAHTASLFPETGAVEVRDRLALAVRPPAAAHERISLSLPVLRAARRLAVLACGAGKADALRRVLAERDPAAPASRLAGGSGEVLYVLDEAAAAGLPG